MPLLQIRKGERDNFPYFSIKNIHCYPSLGPSREDGSNEGLQRMFLWRNKKKNILKLLLIPLLSGPLLCVCEQTVLDPLLLQWH